MWMWISAVNERQRPIISPSFDLATGSRSDPWALAFGPWPRLLSIPKESWKMWSNCLWHFGCTLFSSRQIYPPTPKRGEAASSASNSHCEVHAKFTEYLDGREDYALRINQMKRVLCPKESTPNFRRIQLMSVVKRAEKRQTEKKTKSTPRRFIGQTAFLLRLSQNAPKST